MRLSERVSNHKTLIQTSLISALSLTPPVRVRDSFCCRLLQVEQLRFHPQTGDAGEGTSVCPGSQLCLRSAEGSAFAVCYTPRYHGTQMPLPHFNCCKPSDVVQEL